MANVVECGEHGVNKMTMNMKQSCFSGTHLTVSRLLSSKKIVGSNVIDKSRFYDSICLTSLFFRVTEYHNAEAKLEY